jgi:branched-chain amino acid transport system ATP-binding protein
MLDVDAINTFYGQSQVLFDLSFEVQEGEVVSILGRNGVGKTTTLKSVMGLNPPKKGTVSFKGKDITAKKPYKIFARGIGYVPQGREVFGSLTTLENLQLTQYTAGDGDWSIEEVFDLFPDIDRRRDSNAHNLSGGEQQMLAIGRALMSDPDLLLLDEPSEGLAPAVIDTIEEALMNLRDEGLTILLIEQNLESALKLADRHYIIESGEVVYEGTSEAVEQSNVIDEYLTV